MQASNTINIDFKVQTQKLKLETKKLDTSEKRKEKKM